MTYKNNNSIAYIFASVQIFAVVLFLFESEMSLFFNSIIGTTPYADSKDIFAVAAILFVIFFTGIALRKYKTPEPGQYVIEFPVVVHYALLSMEFVYFFMLGGLVGDVVDRRQLIGTGEVKLSVVKVSTLFLYISTSLLFAKIAMLTHLNQSIRRPKGNKFLIFTAVLTGVVFLLKDIQIGSRGSFLNFIVLSLAGYTFVNPISGRKLIRWTVRYGVIVLLFVSWAFYELTAFRAGGMTGLGIIYDNVLVKFSTTISVVHDYMINDLIVAGFRDGSRITRWVQIETLNWFDRDLSLLDFYPSLKSAIIKYLLFDGQYVVSSVNFLMHGVYPFNSFSFLLPIVLLGFGGVVIFLTFIFMLCKTHFKRLSLCFGVYIYLFYFSMTCFTGISLIEIPFILIPFASFFFSNCFRKLPIQADASEVVYLSIPVRQ